MAPILVLSFVLFSLLQANGFHDNQRDRVLLSNLDQRHTIQPHSILMVTSFSSGHMIPLLTLAEELVHRGHNLTVIIPEIEGDRYGRDICEHKNIYCILVPIPEFTADDVSSRFQQKDSAVLTNLFEIILMLKSMFIHTNNYVQTLNLSQWDIVIIEELMLVSTMCHVRDYNSKAVIIVPHLLNGYWLAPQWPFPNLLSIFSENMSFIERLTNFLIEMTLEVMFTLLLILSTNDYACWSYYDYTVPQTHYFPTIVVTAIGLEYPRTHSPLTEYVGPLIPKVLDPLPGELQTWLDVKTPFSVVYVSMGSVSLMSRECAEAIVNGIPDNYSVLWSMNVHNQIELEGLEIDMTRFYILKWVPQTTVLSHAAIAMAILHGGAGGVHQALYFGVPLIIIPLSSDQMGNAIRVQDSGAGIMLDRDKITAEVVRESVQSVTSGNYRKEAERLRTLFLRAGGVERAAELVEFYASIGYDHLIPSYAKYHWSWIQYNNIDVLCVMLIICTIGVIYSYLTIKLVRHCCDCCDKKKKKD